MFVLKKFLCCIKLETGGVIIGSLGLLLNVLLMLACFFAVGVVQFLSCLDLVKATNFLQGAGTESTKIPDDDCKNLKLVLTALFIFVSFVATGFAVVAFKSVEGIVRRDHLGVRPLMIMLPIFAFLSFLGIFTFTIVGTVYGILHGIGDLYLFLVFYSIFIKLRDEKKPDLTAQHESKLKLTTVPKV